MRAGLALGVFGPREVRAAVLDADSAGRSIRELLERRVSALRRGHRRLPALGSLPNPIVRRPAVRTPTPHDLDLLPKLLAACARRGFATPDAVFAATSRRDFGALLELASDAFDHLVRKAAQPARELARSFGLGHPRLARTAEDSRLLLEDGTFLYIADVFDLDDFVVRLPIPALPSGSLAPGTPLAKVFRRLQKAHQLVDLLDLAQSHEWLAMSSFGMLGETLYDALPSFPSHALSEPAATDELLRILAEADVIDNPEDEDLRALVVDFVGSYRSIDAATMPTTYREDAPGVRCLLDVLEPWASALEAVRTVPKAILGQVGRGVEESSEETLYPNLTLLSDNSFTRTALEEWCDFTANAGYRVSFSLGTSHPEALLACVERLQIELAVFRVATRALAQVLERCDSTRSS